MEGSTVALSVIVPCFNAGATLRRAVESVLSEPVVEVECVVVEDGSTDDSAAVAADLARSDPRVVVVSTPRNEGASAARNRGLDVARGSWVTFLDADDRLLPGGLAALARPALQGGVLAVIGQRVWFNGERRWVSKFYDIPDIRTPGRTSLVDRPGLLYYASATGKLFHRSCIAGLRFHGRVLGDQPWTIRALLRAGDRIEVIADDVYEWSRPRKGEFRPTITAVTRSSARLGLEAAAVASEALEQVRHEAGACLGDRGAADRLTGRYAERLLRSDLGVHLARAIDRRDADTGALVGAITSFVSTIPGGLLGDSDALAHELVEPLLGAWGRLDTEARRAFGALLQAALRADPDLARHTGHRWMRLVVRLAALTPARLGPLPLTIEVRLIRLIRSPSRRARRRRRRLSHRDPRAGA